MRDREIESSDSRTSGLVYVFAFLILALILPACFLSSCGKKGPPTLRSFKSPPPPVLQRALHREDAILLLWSFPSGKETDIARFEVLRSSDGDFGKIAETGKTSRSFTDMGFIGNKLYQYMIVARTSDGSASPGSNVLTVRPVQPPQPPGDVSFTVGSEAVILSWIKTGSGPFYNVYRRFEGGEYGLSPLNDEPLSDNSFRDGLFIDRTVFYTVRSLRNSGVWNEGPPAGELAVNAREFVPSAPEELSSFTAADRVLLFWRGPEETWIRGFRIYRRMNEPEYRVIAETRIPSFIDTDSPGVPRNYRITALGPEKESPAAEISVDFVKH